MTMRRAAAALSLLLLLLAHVTLARESSSLSHKENTLDGYAFQCENVNGENIGAIGFRASNEVYCMNHNDDTSSDRMPCGHYSYQNGALSGYSTLMGSFRAYHLERRDGVVVSFATKEQISCTAVSLDWSNYSHGYFLGLTCPPTADEHTTTRNHFTLGLTGDVALRSVVSTAASAEQAVSESEELLSSATAQDVVTYDYYGVFQYHDETNRLQMHFGPHQGRDTSWALRGTFTRDGGLVLDDGSTGACVHDGQSRVYKADAFTKELLPAARKNSNKRINHRQAWDSTVIAVGHLSATTAAALGVSVTLGKGAPAYGLLAGWGLKTVADGVTKKLNRGRKYISKTLQKGAMIQRMLCVAGSAVCVAASAASAAFDVMTVEQIIESLRKKTSNSDA